jgi:hypothetical protein
MSKIADIQTILEVKADSIWGPMSQAALDTLVQDSGWHAVIASSFADTGDLRRFKRCKADGGSDHDCFKVGDNAIGLWGDSTAEGTGPCCALPPDDWQPFYHLARGKKVIVRANNAEVECDLRDTMPHKAAITNGAGIDLNPDCCAALGLRPPVMAKAAWKWA